jgi:flagellar basal-body rod modification protein FlgD
MSISINGVSSTSDVVTEVIDDGNILDKDSFLLLLTTQLQNQDPTDPMTNQEVVAQLATFSQLEELQNLNSQVDMLNLLQTSMNNATMAGLLGQTVVAEVDTFHYSGEGTKELYFDAEQAASSATLTITDANGDVVWSGSIGALEQGQGSTTWSGLDASGQPLGEGEYTFSVTAVDANGEEIEVTELVRGVVDEMSFVDGVATPSVDGVQVDMGSILSLHTTEDEQ